MTARLIVGDANQVMAGLPDRSVDLVVTSPPFLRFRTYLPEGHPDKHLEIGGEPTPAAYLDTLLELAAEWGRLLSPHGSIAVELGDLYANANVASSEASPGAPRGGFRPTSDDERAGGPVDTWGRASDCGVSDWPLDKCLVGIPTLFAWSLAYGLNLLNGRPSPAGMWRIRTLKPWIRTNPPVGAVGDKERPATSYVIVATKAPDRWFDLDAVRHANPWAEETASSINHRRAAGGRDPGNYDPDHIQQNQAGAPPLDWWHEVDAVLDAALRTYAGGTTHARTAKGVANRDNSGKAAAAGRGGNWYTLAIQHTSAGGEIRGWHLRRALEDAGLLTTREALEVNAAGYSGSHYAVFPPELVRKLIEEMCPRRVCVSCGEPSRRTKNPTPASLSDTASTATGWTSCGCPDTEPDSPNGYHTGSGWRRGLVLDPFVGSGTTLAVAHGHGRDCLGIDLDARNISLVQERCGMFLDVEHHQEWAA